ncbi:MAG: hypothetical protein ACHQUC_08830, partial [Chlamydiales bacterium]
MTAPLPGRKPIDLLPVTDPAPPPVTLKQTTSSREQRVGSTVRATLSPSTPSSPSSSYPSSSPRKPVLKNRGKVGGGFISSVVATGIGIALTPIPEKKGLVDAAKAIMQVNLPDYPQFTALLEMLNFIILPKIVELLEENSHDKIVMSLLRHQELLKEIIEINLVQGFANLSKKVAANRKTSSSLVDLVLTLCQRGSHHISAQQLATIEERYRSHRATFRRLRKELLPSLVFKQNELIQTYLTKYATAANVPARDDDQIQKKQEAKVNILRDLFSKLSPTMPDDVRQEFLQQLEKACNNPENLRQSSNYLAEKIVSNLIHEYVHTSDSKRKSSIEDALFNKTDTTNRRKSFIHSLNEMHKHQNDLRAIFGCVAGEILKELFPKEAKSLSLPAFVPNSLLYKEITTFLTNFLMQLYAPLENDLARNAEWEAELQSKVGGQDLSLFMKTPAALLLGFTKNFIQTSPDAVGSIAEFLGSQLLPPALKELNPSQHSPATPDSGSSTSNSTINEETKSHGEATRKQQLLLAQLTQNQLAEWIVDSIRILLHSEDSLGLGEFFKTACHNLTLALIAKGTELTFSGAAPTPSSLNSTSSSSETQINEYLFFKELADRITPNLQHILGNSKISDQFWKDLVKDLPLPPFLIELLLPSILKKAEELQESLHLHPSSPGTAEDALIGPQRDTNAILLSYKGGVEIIGILDKLTKKIVEKAVKSNLGLITEFGWQDQIEELMDIYLPGIKVTEDLKRWFSNNVNAFSIGTEETSSQSIGLLKRGIAMILQEAVINIIQQNFGDSSENYAAQLLSKIHTAFRKAFANYDDATTRKQIILETAIGLSQKVQDFESESLEMGADHSQKVKAAPISNDSDSKDRAFWPAPTAVSRIKDGQAIQAEIRKLESEVEELSKRNAQLKKQGSEEAIPLTNDQKTQLEALEKAKWRHSRGEISIVEIRRKLDKAMAKLNKACPEAPWMIGQFQSLLLDPDKPLLQKIIQSLQNPAEKTSLISKARSRIDNSEQDRALIRMFEMPTEQLQLLSEGLNLISTLKNAEKEQRTLRSELQTCKRAVARINSQEMAHPQMWESVANLQEISLA